MCVLPTEPYACGLFVCGCVCVGDDSWNGSPDNWQGGHPGDGKVYHKTAYISSVSITPFNEPNDIMAPTPVDQPDGCDVYYSESELRTATVGVDGVLCSPLRCHTSPVCFHHESAKLPLFPRVLCHSFHAKSLL
jgi:hypothetical protein